jgi:hypothetical protein
MGRLAHYPSDVRSVAFGFAEPPVVAGVLARRSDYCGAAGGPGLRAKRAADNAGASACRAGKQGIDKWAPHNVDLPTERRTAMQTPFVSALIGAAVLMSAAAA